MPTLLTMFVGAVFSRTRKKNASEQKRKKNESERKRQ